MSFQVGGACYETAVQAAQASASAQVGSIVSHGGSAYVVGVSSVTGSAISYDLQPVAGGSSISVVVGYSAQPCGMLDAADAVGIGWAIAGVWLGVFALRFLARTVYEGWNRADGDA